ncbi:MAG: DUF3106 domain-containing protein [Acidobacteriota bacterium]|nr:DUF3106 domain-containing protein [Acidobacteriota bacterium]
MMRGNSIPALIVCLLLAAPLTAQHHASAPQAPRGPAPLYVPRGEAHVQRNTMPPSQGHNNSRPEVSGARGGAPNNAGPAQHANQPQAQPHSILRGQGPHTGDWLRDNRKLSPDEQRHLLQQDPNFNRLPPQRQQQLVNRLQKFNSMTPQQQQRVLNRMQMMEHLPPAQQQRANQLFGQFKQMPEARKQAVRQELHQMHNMPPEAREHELDSPELRNRFSPDELRMLRGFNDIGFIE